MTVKLKLVPRPSLSVRLADRPNVVARVTPRLSGATIVEGDNIDVTRVGNVYTISLDTSLVYAAAFGVTANGSTNDTVALAAAIAAAEATGKTLVLPAGSIKVSSGFTITGRIDIMGAGTGHTAQGTASGGTIIKPTGAMTVFTVSSLTGSVFRGFSIEFPAATPSTSNCIGITLTHSSTYNSGTRIQNMHFAYCDYAINTVSAANWHIDSCIIWACNVGIFVNNAHNGDHGDSCISNCTIVMAVIANVYGILQISSGGLKVCNNKIAGGDYGYIMSLNTTTNTGILLISNNSIELQRSGAMLFQRDPSDTTHSFSFITITGNEISAAATASPSFNLYIPANGTGTWVYDITITGNVFIGSSVANSYCVYADKCDGIVVGDNHFVSANSSSYAIGFGGNAANAVRGVNSFRGTFLDDSTAWKTYTPTITAASGTFTSVAASGRWKQIGKLVHCEVGISITTVGTAGTAIIIPLPVTAAGTGDVGSGRENARLGTSMIVWLADTTHAYAQQYDGTFPFINGDSPSISIVYEAA